MSIAFCAARSRRSPGAVPVKFAREKLGAATRTEAAFKAAVGKLIEP
jgi:hypothetical protein